MTDISAQQEVSLESLVAQAADEFLQRRKQGQEPDIEEYAARYPQAAALIRKALAALQIIGLPRVAGSPGAGGSAAVMVGGSLGDFHILREIGRGGMGVVYEAVQESLGRHVALAESGWSSPTSNPSMPPCSGRSAQTDDGWPRSEAMRAGSMSGTPILGRKCSPSTEPAWSAA